MKTEMPMAYGNEVRQLIDRIDAAGVPKSYVRQLVPDWWTAEVEKLPSAIAELKLLFARRLGLEIAPLVGADEVKFSVPHGLKFKRAVSLREGVSEPAVAYLYALSRALISASRLEPQPLPATASALREAILSDTRVRWVSLNALLKFCWQHGIVVAHVRKFPPFARRLDAVSIRVSGRPVILLAKQAKPDAWQAFILAHEIAHLALGHVQDDEILVDEVFEALSASDDEDPDEAAADEFALELLGQSARRIFKIDPDKTNAPALARVALETGKTLRVDPGHIVLRVANTYGLWPMGQAALRLLDRDADAPATINERAAQFLDRDALAIDATDAVVEALALPSD